MTIIRTSLSVAICLLLATTAGAGDRVRVYSSGHWQVHKEEMLYSLGKGIFLGIDACVARTQVDKGILELGVRKGDVYFQVSWDEWNSRPKTREIKVKAGDKVVRLPQASHYSDIVSNMIPAKENGIGSMTLLASTGENVQILNKRGKQVAVFSGKGFEAALARTVRCSKKIR